MPFPHNPFLARALTIDRTAGIMDRAVRADPPGVRAAPCGYRTGPRCLYPGENMAAKTVDPNAWANRWKTGMGSAGAKYTDGINRTTVNPMALAAQPDAMQRYQDGCTRSVTSGKRAASLNAADPGLWKKNAVQYGAAALATGANKAMPKVQAVAQKWAPIMSQASAAANALPKGGMGNALARVQASLAVIMGAAGTA